MGQRSPKGSAFAKRKASLDSGQKGGKSVSMIGAPFGQRPTDLAASQIMASGSPSRPIPAASFAKKFQNAATFCSIFRYTRYVPFFPKSRPEGQWGFVFSGNKPARS